MPDAPTYVPIAADEQGNEMFFLHQSFVGNTEDEAREIGLGASLVEFLLSGVRYRRVQQIDVHNTPHVPARLGGYDVALIAGPAFDAAQEEPSHARDA